MEATHSAATDATEATERAATEATEAMDLKKRERKERSGGRLGEVKPDLALASIFEVRVETWKGSISYRVVAAALRLTEATDLRQKER